MVLSVIAMSGFVVAPSAKASASTGDLIKMSGLSSVYYLGADGKRYVFPNSTTYFSWYSDFSGVVTIPAAELQSYPLGGNVTMRAGTKLVKITTDPSVYAVTPNGVLSKIQTEAQAAALYGTNWSKRVVDVPDAFFTNYTIGSALVNGAIPTGSLVQNSGSASVYYYDGTNYRLIANETALNANRFWASNILTTTTAITASGSQIVGAENNLINVAQNGGNGSIVVTGSGLMVSLNANTAPAATVISTTGTIGQSIAPLASFNLTAANDGAVTVKSIRLQRIGVSSDSSLANIYLYNGTTKITDAGTFSSGFVTFSNNTGIVTIPAGQTTTITVRADIANVTGGNVGVAIASASDIVATASSVSGSFPIQGNLMSITQVTDLATVKASTVTPNGSNLTVNAGTLQQTLWSSQLSVGQKAVKLSYVAFRQIGSISSDAIQNLGLYVNGTKVGATTSVGSDGYARFDFASSPITLSTGASTVELRGDIVKGSNYNYIFSIQTAADIVLTDTNYGVNVALTGQSSSLPLSASQTTISSGSVSAQLDPAFTATQFVGNQAQTTLGQWTMKAYGEDIKVQQLTASITMSKTATGTTPTTAEGFNNVTLYVNGGSVGSTNNAVAIMDTSASNQTLPTVTFGSTNLFTIPAGTTVTVTLKGDSVLNSPTSVTSVTANLVAPINAFEGITSFTYTPPTVALPINGTSLSAGTSNATVSANGGYTNQTLSSNTIGQKIGSYMIQASSADGVQVSSLNVGFQTGTDLTKLANLYIVTPDMPSGSNKVNPASSNNFTTNFTVAANQTAEVDVYADLTNTASSFYTTLTGNGLGTTSHQSVTLTSATGQAITVGNGNLSTLTLSNSSPVSQIIVGGTNGMSAATYNFVASTAGGVNISELGFSIASSTTVSTAVSSITVNGQTATVVGGKALVSGLNLTVPASYGGVDVPVTVNLAPVGLNGVQDQPVVISLAHVKYLSGGTTFVDDAPSLGNGATAFGGGLHDTNLYGGVATGTPAHTMQLAGVAPVITLISSAAHSLTTGTVKIGSVQVVAPTGNVTLNNLPLVITISGGTLGSGNILVKDSSTGSDIPVSAVASNADTQTITFTPGYTISAGSAGKTFDIYAAVAGFTGTIQSGSASVNLGLASDKNLFSWHDVTGNSSPDLTGAYILNYPNTTVYTQN